MALPDSLSEPVYEGGLVGKLIHECRGALTGTLHVPHQMHWNSDYEHCAWKEACPDVWALLGLHLDLLYQMRLENDGVYYYSNEQ